jgi:hypothetical protein
MEICLQKIRQIFDDMSKDTKELGFGQRNGPKLGI